MYNIPALLVNNSRYLSLARKGATVANHSALIASQESSLFDDRFGVISQDDWNQFDQQDVVAGSAETCDSFLLKRRTRTKTAVL